MIVRKPRSAYRGYVDVITKIDPQSGSLWELEQPLRQLHYVVSSQVHEVQIWQAGKPDRQFGCVSIAQ
ncbi:hypothetical protein D3C76_1792560 [compost metagenome]